MPLAVRIVLSSFSLAADVGNLSSAGCVDGLELKHAAWLLLEALFGMEFLVVGVWLAVEVVPDQLEVRQKGQIRVVGECRLGLFCLVVCLVWSCLGSLCNELSTKSREAS